MYWCVGVVNFLNLYVITFSSTLRFLRINSFLISFVLSRVHDLMLSVLFTFIGVLREFHIKWYLCCLMTGVTSRAGTDSHSEGFEITSVLVRVCVAQYLVVVICRSLFVPLYILFFDWWFQIIPLEFSNFSCDRPRVVLITKRRCTPLHYICSVFSL